MLKKNSNVHKLITEQIKDVELCLVHFENFLRAAMTPETVHETLRALCHGVQTAEATADSSLRAMIDAVNSGSYLPSTRQEIISIATSCDKIANKCETLSKMIVFQRITCPSLFSADIMEIFALTQKQFSLLEESISRLFSKISALLQDHSILDQIRALESEVDEIEDRLTEKVFAMDMELAAKLQFSSVVELLSDLSDIIEDIADKIQTMLISRKA